MDFQNDSSFDENEEGFEVRDFSELNTFGSKNDVFNHETLVMRIYQKVQDALAQEMVNGFNSIERDMRGKEYVIYHKDTRNEAIESIKTLKNTMIADIKDTPFHRNINILLEELKRKYEEYLKRQKNYYNSLNQTQRLEMLKTNPEFIEAIGTNNLCPDSFLSDSFINLAVDIYRDIFEQLELCLCERKYFKRKKIIENGIKD